jgi:hypothetical protein
MFYCCLSSSCFSLIIATKTNIMLYHYIEAPDECETAGMVFSCGQTTAPDFISNAVEYSALKPATVYSLNNILKNIFYHKLDGWWKCG